jgi:hypothetical protein
MKRERAELRKLADYIYEAELAALLEDLALSFEAWRAGTLLSSELSQAIHAFHQGESRRLWSNYQTLKDHDIVARGVAIGLISQDRVPAPIRDKLGSAH